MEEPNSSPFMWQKIIGKISVGFIIFSATTTALILIASIFGIKLMNVVSESMLPVYEVGDLVVTNQNTSNFKVGDIITLTPEWFEQGIIIHRIDQIDDEYVVTKGDNNPTADPATPRELVLGKAVFSVPHAAKFITAPIIIASNLIALGLYLLSTLILRKEYWETRHSSGTDGDDDEVGTQ